jgi:hypothetical protein
MRPEDLKQTIETMASEVPVPTNDVVVVIAQGRRRRMQRRVALAGVATILIAAVAIVRVVLPGDHTTHIVSTGSATTAAPTTTTVSLSHQLANLGPCPPRLPVLTAESNTGITGLAKRLVPITASTVRVCMYDYLNGRVVSESATSANPNVADFLEAVTNGVPRQVASEPQTAQSSRRRCTSGGWGGLSLVAVGGLRPVVFGDAPKRTESVSVLPGVAFSRSIAPSSTVAAVG